MLLISLLITGCGGGDSAPPSTAAPQQASSGLGPLAAQGAPSGGEKSAPLAVTDEPAVPSADSATMVQLSALPHLSSLSDREKAGLLMLLPSKSSSQRLALINMYPSLVKLPEQQKELLLDRLEKIVPVTVSERQ
ncbi:hypothetical protein [Burkholderia ambifaria]|uniref:hypothetical protein n=1 Tax=Burkholderia ambifaria TaxID=152480 RepID=UPI001FC8765F|nr:hypothetical protein [Burkholderia ambifaria]